MKRIALFLFVQVLLGGPPLQKYEPVILSDNLPPVSIMGRVDRKVGIHKGNKVRTKFFNYGPIGGPGRVNPYPRLEWPAYSGHEYGYEMGPLIGVKVKGYDPATHDSVWIIWVDDPIQDGGDEDFEPLPGYANPNQDTLAFSDNETTWPDVWGPYISIYGDTIVNLSGAWPGQFNYITPDGEVQSVVVADEESFYIMTDEGADELQDSTGPVYDPGNGLKGVGIQVTVRGYQWAASMAEDIIIWVYEVTNISAKDIDTVVVGYFGDFDIGGYPDYGDDMFGFDTLQNMVYNWDLDGQSPNFSPGEPIGWLGFKFLESPGNPYDGIDNDGDGLVDESQYNGIDDDGDWDATDEEAAQDPNDADGLSDDVGMDGIPGTGDYGEGDGIPTLGEPDFEIMDLDEKDQLGLTGVSSFIYGTAYASQDTVMWDYMKPGNYNVIPGPGDIVSVFSSGYFPLKVGETQRFSIAIILGYDSLDLYENAFIAQKIYELNYRFTRPPLTPTVWAVVGNKSVTLYWDDAAERSIDPFLVTIDTLLAKDFEGYAIYRSEDRGVTWGEPITDAYGRVVGYKPIAIFDLDDGIKGLFPIGVNGYHFYLGDDTGIRHSFTDTTVINGKHYWYAVTAFDRGVYVHEGDTLGLIPLESPKVLGRNNVVEVVPGGPSPGVESPYLSITHINGFGTGKIDYFIDPHRIQDGKKYLLVFETDGDTTYSIYDITGEDTTLLYSDVEYIHGEDGGPVFDGVRLIIENDPLQFDDSLSGWVRGRSTFMPNVAVAPGGTPVPFDYLITFYDHVVDTDIFGKPVTFTVYNITKSEPVDFFFNVLGQDSMVRRSTDFIILFEEGMQPTWQINFSIEGRADPPYVGDELLIAFKKPFTVQDTFVIESHAPRVNVELARSMLDSIAVVPNPYVVAARWELKDPNIKYGRGPREIHFINLPPVCTIRIYTLTGELVRTIYHEKSPQDPEASLERWNLLNKDGQEVSYGLYIYHVEAPGIGEKIGKFAIIK